MYTKGQGASREEPPCLWSADFTVENCEPSDENLAFPEDVKNVTVMLTTKKKEVITPFTKLFNE